MKLLAGIVGVLLIGFLLYNAIYIAALPSAHGRYLVSYNWQHWGLTRQSVLVFVVYPPGAVSNRNLPALPTIPARLVRKSALWLYAMKHDDVCVTS